MMPRLEIAVLASLIAFIAVVSLFTYSSQPSWEGADGQAENVVSDLTGGSYTPWFNPIWEPPSPEIETLLFCLQAAIGGLVIGYFLGYYRRGNRT